MRGCIECSEHVGKSLCLPSTAKGTCHMSTACKLASLQRADEAASVAFVGAGLASYAMKCRALLEVRSKDGTRPLGITVWDQTFGNKTHQSCHPCCERANIHKLWVRGVLL